MLKRVTVLSISGLLALGTGAAWAAPANVGSLSPGEQTGAVASEHVVQVRHGHRHWRGQRSHGWHRGYRWYRPYYGYRPYYYYPRPYYYRNYYYPSYYYSPYYYPQPRLGFYLGF